MPVMQNLQAIAQPTWVETQSVFRSVGGHVDALDEPPVAGAQAVLDGAVGAALLEVLGERLEGAPLAELRAERLREVGHLRRSR